MDVRNLNLASRPISEIFGDNPELLYEMPKFQREYVWKKNDWDKFFKDLTAEDIGHFLGSIIGIEPATIYEKDPKIKVIDGQQRQYEIVQIDWLKKFFLCLLSKTIDDSNDVY